jgi:glycine cleavage system H protein
VESVKAASDVYSPVSGEVLETNGALEASPQQVNEAPESDGWLIKLKVADPAELDALMDEAGYRDFVANL